MDDRERKIRAMAHQIWDEAGRPEGQEAKHWEEAERRLFPAGAAKPPVERRSVKTASKSKTIAKNAGNSGVAAPPAKALKGAAVDVKPSKTAPRKPAAAANAPTKTPSAPPPKSVEPKSPKPKPRA